MTLGVAGRNWTLKLTALCLAILLWVVVRIEAVDGRSVSGIPVQVLVNDPEWTLIGAPDPATVEVSFTGPIRALLALGSQTPPIRIVLDEITSADTVLALSEEWVALQAESGVAAAEVQPATVRLAFDRYETVVLPFEASLEGSLDSTLALAARPAVIPPMARVRGPSRQLAQLTGIPVGALDLGMVSGSGRTMVAVDSTAIGTDVEVEARTVEVELTIEAHLSRTFFSVPVQVEGAADLESDPAYVDVTVEGAASVVEALEPTDIALVARAPVTPVAEAGVEMVLTVRDLPEFVIATPAIELVRLRPPSESEPNRQ